MSEHVDAFLAHVGAVSCQCEVGRFRCDIEFIEEVVEHTAVGIENHPLQCADTQMLKRDAMLVAHGLQMAGQHPSDGFDFGLRAEGTDALDFLRQHHVVVRDVGHDE